VLATLMANPLQRCGQLAQRHVIGDGAEDGGPPCTATVAAGSKLVSCVTITVVLVGMLCGLLATRVVALGKIRYQHATKDAPRTDQVNNFLQHVVWDTAPSTLGLALHL